MSAMKQIQGFRPLKVLNLGYQAPYSAGKGTVIPSTMSVVGLDLPCCLRHYSPVKEATDGICKKRPRPPLALTIPLWNP